MRKRDQIRQLERQVAALTEQKRALLARAERAETTISNVRKALGPSSNIVVYGGGGAGSVTVQP